MWFWPIKSLISSPFIEIFLYIANLILEWVLQCGIVFFIFTPIKFLFNISRSWWPFQCLNPRQRYQARLLVEKGGVISIGVVRVTYRKPGCGPLWVLYVGVYVLQLLWGMWYLLGIVIISVLLWLTCTNHWLDKRLTWLILLIIALLRMYYLTLKIDMLWK
jgi:hypothetical protein